MRGLEPACWPRPPVHTVSGKFLKLRVYIRVYNRVPFKGSVIGFPVRVPCKASCRFRVQGLLRGSWELVSKDIGRVMIWDKPT